MTYYRNPKIKKVSIDYNRMDLDEDRLDGPKADYGVTAIGYHKAMELLAMAMEGIVPNGHYSDFECQIWIQNDLMPGRSGAYLRLINLRRFCGVFSFFS